MDQFFGPYPLQKYVGYTQNDGDDRPLFLEEICCQMLFCGTSHTLILLFIEQQNTTALQMILCLPPVSPKKNAFILIFIYEGGTKLFGRIIFSPPPNKIWIPELTIFWKKPTCYLKKKPRIILLTDTHTAHRTFTHQNVQIPFKK